MPKLFATVILLVCSSAIASALAVEPASITTRSSHSALSEKICVKDAAALRKKSGRYLATEYLDSVKRTHLWFSNEPIEDQYELIIGPTGEADFSSWHEGWPVERDACLTFFGRTVTAAESTISDRIVRFTYAGPVDDNDASYFNLIFKGCFSDESGQSWCFTPNKIRIEGVEKSALLQLDASELPTPGSILKVEGEDKFWVFKPVGDGWAVLKSDWASSDYFVELDWTHPWRKLTPVEAVDRTTRTR